MTNPDRWITDYFPDVDTAYVRPIKDAVDHTMSDDCVCGPAIEPLQRDDGTVCWLVTHHSLIESEA